MAHNITGTRCNPTCVSRIYVGGRSQRALIVGRDNDADPLRKGQKQASHQLLTCDMGTIHANGVPSNELELQVRLIPRQPTTKADWETEAVWHIQTSARS